MKKRVVIFAGLMLGLAISAGAQKEESPLANDFKPGWFLGANGGINWFLGEGNNFIRPNAGNKVDLIKGIGVLGRASLAYKFTPVYALRGSLGYNHNNHYRPGPNNTDVMNVFNTGTLNADLLINLSNKNLGYDANRKVDFSIFGGAGLAYLNNNIGLLGGLVRGGFQGDYNINPKLALNLIAELNILQDNYNNEAESVPFDLSPAVTIGLSYKITKPTKKAKVAPVVEEVVQQKTDLADKSTNVIEKKDTIVKKVVDNTLVADTKTVKSTKDSIVKIVKDVYNAGLNEKMFFAINNANVEDAKYQVSIDKIAEFVKAHPDAIITVSGYADKSTGSVDANNMMSKMRAVNVANTLIRQYGVDYKNIVVKWYGGGVQPYLVQSKNRLATVKSPATKNGISVKKAEHTAPVVSESTKVKLNTTSQNEDRKDLFLVVNFVDNAFDVIDSKQEAVIKAVAAYMTKYPQTKILVSGYADKASGNINANTELSKKRAENVANVLIKKYAISSDRIQTKWFGVVAKQTASTPSMNRLVLIETIK